MTRESTDAALDRWKRLGLLQDHYREFLPFLEDVMDLLGFSVSELQADIAHFMEHGPASLMIQAQRGQAKTTIAAAYAVWSLIHTPKLRVLILSAGGTQANEISTLIVRVIMTMDVLEDLRPDKNAGDRTSVEAFDVHHSLKGVDKSPSVACVGITANLQGKRADLLIADDVESVKNATTALQRQQLQHLTLDFTSICRAGRILWLGTPQSNDSIYNSLPGRGVTIRIWPGRFPTAAQLDHYGAYLAPYITTRLEANPSLGQGGGIARDQGQPSDPVLMDEEQLQRKELDQGPAYFQLQHMLNTRLTDAMRHPLKTERLVVLRLTGKVVPLSVTPSYSSLDLLTANVHGFGFKVARTHKVSQETGLVPTIHMYVDPAGGGANGDETGYAVSGFLAGNIYLYAVGGLPGGYGVDTLRALARIVKKWGVGTLTIEKNMGYGAFREVFLPILRAEYDNGHGPEVLDDYVTGQKEMRIINTLEPIMGRGSLIVNEDILEFDRDSTALYEAKHRLSYSFFHQLSKITRERNALLHDDRLDAVEGTCRHWQALIAQDQHKAVVKAQATAWAEQIKDPLGYNRYKRGQTAASILDARRRKR
jgi:hypothetical protein